MTLSEFDRRCHGYLRRTAQRDKPLRLIAAILLNANRGEGDAPITPEQLMPLYGDVLPPEIEPLAPEQVEADFARAADLDADLFPRNV